MVVTSTPSRGNNMQRTRPHRVRTRRIVSVKQLVVGPKLTVTHIAWSRLPVEHTVIERRSKSASERTQVYLAVLVGFHLLG